MDKEGVVYTYIMEYYSAIRKEQNNAICSNMDGPRDYHTKRSESERERQIPYDITYMQNLKYGTNEPMYETETDSQTENKHVVAKAGVQRRKGLGVWDQPMQTIIYRMDKQQGPTIQYRELYSISCDKP